MDRAELTRRQAAFSFKRCEGHSRHSDNHATSRRYNTVVLEPHFTVSQFANPWGLSHSTFVRHFKGEPGVLHIGNINSRRRTKVIIRIPLSIAERIHKRLSLME